MSRSDGEEIFLTQNTFSQENNDDNLDLCNFFLEYDTTTTSETYSVACSDISEDEGFSNPKLTQSDDELLLNVSKIQSKSHQPSTSRFHEPKTDKEIEDMQSKKFADSTMSKIKWATTLFKQWKSTRNIRANDPNVGLSPIRVDLAEMSLGELKSSRSKKQAEEISLEEEEKLWASGSLGSDNARHLLNTLVYLIGLNFALRGGQEHRDLKGGNSAQFQINEKNGSKCLIYTEAKSKADQGGIKHKNVKRKSVVAYQNTENQARCVVNLFELYASHCPPFPRKADALYLRPLKIPNGNIWYADQPIGRHSLANIEASICQEAGIGGYRTNHSLRPSAATRMYDAGVDEQLICEVTGHRSNAVRNYKRTNEKQKRKINSVIQGRTDSENDDSGKFKISKS
ncbi:unnamed protein product [Mytilus coruscus]|uniref:ZMYM2-like/QRICH1 C-terminal domain-containing protein n=1 Tax=Mytilus coruscus TaxID=42192 RepID=A0A6J8ESH3_MYTCO|nr:unnamed protein product [Mytilus coruscus]